MLGDSLIPLICGCFHMLPLRLDDTRVKPVGLDEFMLMGIKA